MEIRPSSSLSVKLSEKKPEADDSGERALNQLKSSVDDNEATAKNLSQAGGDDVRSANIEASRSEVRDVDTASKIAKDLATSISKEPDRAIAAQTANQSAPKIQELLS